MAQLDDRTRLAAIDATGLVDRPPHAAFVRASRMAAALLDVPIAHTTLVLADRQFYPGQVGLPPEVAEAAGTPLSYSFCKHVVETGEPFVIADTRNEPRLQDNLAVSEYGVASYAGVPLAADTGEIVGTVCALSFEMREWTDEEVAHLTDLASMLHTELVLREELKRLRDAKDQAMAAGLLVSRLQRAGEGVESALSELAQPERSDHLESASADLRSALDAGRRYATRQTG